MNKPELIEAVVAARSCTKVEAAAIIEMFFDAENGIISKQLQAGDDVRISGFGIFSAKRREARTGINPKTKAAIQIAASCAPKFKAGSTLRDALNKK